MLEGPARIHQEAAVNIGFVCQLKTVCEEHGMLDVKIRGLSKRYFIALQ
jgi:hypothetical protein